jgi:hypothetical protein
MTFKITYARKWYEYEYTARLQKNGLFTLSCYCTDPDGYYCAHKSYTVRDVSRNEIDRLFGM